MTTIGWQTLGPNEPRSEKCFDSENYSIAEAMQMMRVDWPSFVLRSSPFAIWGRADEGLYHPVPESLFTRLHDGTPTESIAIDRSEIVDHARNTHWRDVRCIPIFRAPNASVLLHGVGVKDAFEQFVLNDPKARGAKDAARA